MSIQTSIQRELQKIEGFRDLPSNWDRDGRERISTKAIDVAKEFLTSLEGMLDGNENVSKWHCHAAPSSDGKIEVELTHVQQEFEFFLLFDVSPEGSIGYSYLKCLKRREKQLELIDEWEGTSVFDACARLKAKMVEK